VAVRQAQTARAGNQAVLNYHPASGAGPCCTYYSDKQLSVGETVNLSPRAGCARCACPVRRALRLEVHAVQLPEMATAAKRSSQPRTESCVMSGNGHCEA